MDVAPMPPEKPVPRSIQTDKPVLKPPLTRVGAPKMPPRPTHPFKVNMDVVPPKRPAPPAIPRSPEDSSSSDSPTAVSTAIAAASTEVPIVTSFKEMPNHSKAEEVKAPVVAKAPTKPAKYDRKGSWKRVVFILFLMIVMVAAGAGYAYWQTKHAIPFLQKAKKSSASTTQTTTAKPTKVSASDVDQTTINLNSGLSKLNDAKDFNSSDLSNTSLGL